MGLADRVEAWARRFGVPPPQDGVDDALEDVGEDGDVPRAEEREARERHAGDERFTRRVRQQR